MSAPGAAMAENVAEAVSPRAALLEAAAALLDALTVPGPLLVAFSGGGDSTGLLWALATVLKSRAPSPITLHSCTIDHDLRPGSAEEAACAGAISRRLGVSHIILPWRHTRPTTGLQAAARRARYRLLTQEGVRLGAVAVLSGHNRDDQLETIAMRRARGEGEGLSGMARSVLLEGRMWLVRPLLGLSRETIRLALREEGLDWIDDPSNSNGHFERVRLRGQKQPHDFPSPETRLSAARRQAEWLSRNVRVIAGAAACVERAALDDLADADQARALFKLSAALAGKVFLPSSDQRARIAAALSVSKSGRVTCGGTVFDLRAGGLYLYRESRNLPVLTLQPGEEGVWDGRFLMCNRGTETVTISAAGAGSGLAERFEREGLPAAIARRAAPAMPFIASDGKATMIATSRQIAAHAAFLPAFELPLAECFASLFHLQSPPKLPFSAPYGE